MTTHDPRNKKNGVGANIAAPNQTEPSMSAPSPMPGRPAASYVQQPPGHSQAEWQPQQNQRSGQAWGWSTQYPPQQNYQSPPSQGIPGGQVQPPQYGSWQQGYVPGPMQGYQQPAGRGWTQPYSQQNPNTWQGGYTVGQWTGNGYASMQPDGQGGGHSGCNGSGTGGNPPADRTTAFKLTAAAAVILIALVLVVGLLVRKNQTDALYASVSAYNNLYCEGVYVDGIHLGGMTQEEAYNAVQKSAQLKCDEWHVQLVTADGTYLDEINSYDLGMTVHVEDALEAAWQQGHTGATASERKAEMDALLYTPYLGSTALPSGNTAIVDQILNEIAEAAYVAPQDATFQFDPELTNPFTIVPEVVGQYLDVNSVKGQVYDMVSRMESGVITLATTPIYPAVTAEDVKQKTTLIATAYTPISSTSTENRDANISRACHLINGTVIEPGKTFSFNNVVGPRTKKNGFYLATVYAYGKEEEGYGGGVCQVSSTMYWAAIRANLEIVKREQHGQKVGYIALGYDATVNYDGRKIDFSFSNNTDSPLYIITKVRWMPSVDSKHYLVVCELYGQAPEANVTYDIVTTETVLPVPEEIEIVQDTEALYVTYADETKTIPGTTGVQVESYKVKYVDGQEVERTHLHTDTYKPTQTVTYVGVNERPIATETPW